MGGGGYLPVVWIARSLEGSGNVSTAPRKSERADSPTVVAWIAGGKDRVKRGKAIATSRVKIDAIGGDVGQSYRGKLIPTVATFPWVWEGNLGGGRRFTNAEIREGSAIGDPGAEYFHLITGCCCAITREACNSHSCSSLSRREWEPRAQYGSQNTYIESNNIYLWQGTAPACPLASVGNTRM